MTVVQFKQGAIFLAVSVAVGLGAALIAVRFWPQLLLRDAPAEVTVPVVAVDPGPAAIQTVATAPPPVQSTPVESTPAATASFSYAPAVRASAPAVVNIYAQRTITERLPTVGLESMLRGPMQPRYRERVQRGLGSGVIVDTAGHIVTNHHVIAGADEINVQLGDGRTAVATVVGRDQDTDLAVLSIKLKPLPVMKLGRSDQIQVGDVVLAIGSPLGLTQTVTHGIVSATGRAQLGVATYENFIQTDAAINVGNSGGALVNGRGELIGINTAVLGKNLGAEGIGVAIPVDLVRGVMREILDHGRVIRGWIGIVPEDINDEQARALGLAHGGVIISNLYVGSPALVAGLTRGDILETVDGRPARNAQDTLAQIARRKPGESVKLTGLRGQQAFKLDLKVIEPPTAP
ncbi:MAG: trypsin-like peptidase domain-containing protein [Pseudomonadota bacterium]